MVGYSLASSADASGTFILRLDIRVIPNAVPQGDYSTGFPESASFLILACRFAPTGRRAQKFR
jgi:hypothetical protein